MNDESKFMSKQYDYSYFSHLQPDSYESYLILYTQV